VTELEQQRASLPNDWASEEDSFASFLAFRSLDDGVKAGWLAYAVSQSLKASLASGTHACAFQSRLGAEIGIDMAQHWRPGAENFFDRIKKAQILTILGGFDPEIALRYGGQEDRTGDGCGAPVFWRHDHRARDQGQGACLGARCDALWCLADDLVGDGIAPDPSLMGPRICPRRRQSERCRRPAQPRPDPQSRTATRPILLPRQSGRRMQTREQGSDQEETIP
jgi:ParB family chromosome partitioning protein